MFCYLVQGHCLGVVERDQPRPSGGFTFRSLLGETRGRHLASTIKRYHEFAQREILNCARTGICPVRKSFTRLWTTGQTRSSSSAPTELQTRTSDALSAVQYFFWSVWLRSGAVTSPSPPSVSPLPARVVALSSESTGRPCDQTQRVCGNMLDGCSACAPVQRLSARRSPHVPTGPRPKHVDHQPPGGRCRVQGLAN